MDWIVKKVGNADAERQHLNKILEEIRAAINAAGTGTSTTNVIERTNTRYAVARFNLTLAGDVTGTAEVDGLGDVTIDASLDPDSMSGFVEEAPVDSRYYWRRNAEWRAVPNNIAQISEITGNGFAVSYQADEDSIREWITREIQGTTNNIVVTNGTGVAGNPVINLATVADSNTGTLQGVTVDGFGRVTGTTDGTITGTLDRITVTNGNAAAGPPTITIAATYPGQTSIVTLGTVTTGTWNASIIQPPYGGTGIASYTVGDLLYASGATTLSKLADVVTGHALISGGVATAPSWGKIGLATHVSGNLPVTNLNSGTAADATTFWRGDETWAVPTGTYTDESAQDAVGAMVDATLVYVDATPSLGRAAISGDITIAAGSNVSAIGAGVIVDADVNASAAIAVTKLAALTADRAVITNGSGFLAAATTTATEIGYVNGVTSAIQTQLNNKQPLDTQLTDLAALTYAGNGGLFIRVKATEDGWELAAGGGGGYTDEQAQDAVGAMVDSTLVYTDATPLLSRAALTGDVTAPAGSNTTTLATIQPAVHTWQDTQTVYEHLSIVDADADAISILSWSSAAGYASASGRGWRITCSSEDSVQGSLSIERWNGLNWAIVGNWTTTALTINGNTAWHAGNDGAGSGLDADTIDGLNPTTVGGNLLTLANPSAVRFIRINADNTVTARSAADFRTDLALVPGTDVQTQDAQLEAIAGLTPSNDQFIYWTGATTAAMTGITADARLLLADADVPRLGTVNIWTDEQTHNLASSIKRNKIVSAGAGQTSVGQTHGGLLIATTAMNTTNKYGIGVLFASADADFTTTNPKFLAGIIPVALENYTSDTAGKMGMAFYATGAAPGATPTPTEVAVLSTDGLTLTTPLGIASGGLGTAFTLTGNALKVVRVNAGETGFELATVSGGSLSDGDKGDVTVSGSGATWTIDNDVVTYAKMQNVSATKRVLARKTAGAGDVEEATAEEVLEFIGTPAQGDIFYRNATTTVRLAAGSVGQGLFTGGAGANPSWGGTAKLLGTYTVAGAAVTTMPLDLSALDMSPYKALEIRFSVKNNTGSNSNISLYWEGDTTAANYDRQLFTYSGTTASGGRANDGVLFTLAANGLATGVISTRSDVDNDLRSCVQVNEGITTAIVIRFAVHTYRSGVAITDVDTITLSSAVASAFAIGSTFSVWGLS